MTHTRRIVNDRVEHLHAGFKHPETGKGGYSKWHDLELKHTSPVTNRYHHAEISHVKRAEELKGATGTTRINRFPRYSVLSAVGHKAYHAALHSIIEKHQKKHSLKGDNVKVDSVHHIYSGAWGKFKASGWQKSGTHRNDKWVYKGKVK